MKRIIIGGCMLFSGLLVTLTIIVSASIYATDVFEWSGKSKLWFVIFGAEHYGEVVDSLFLGFPFVLGVLLALLGLIILGLEYYRTFRE